MHIPIEFHEPRHISITSSSCQLSRIVYHPTNDPAPGYLRCLSTSGDDVFTMDVRVALARQRTLWIQAMIGA